jgi:Uma2 family endonuclease
MALVKAVDPRVSFAELQQWPDDGRRYELYDGEVIVVPAPVPRHQLVAARITSLLLEFARESGSLALPSPIDIAFTEHDVLQPDVVLFRRERCSLIAMMEVIRIAPDLAVEVVSRSTEARDRGRKMQVFARFGVGEYWIVDPVRNVLEIYQLQGGGYLLVAVCSEKDHVESATFNGLSFDARRIFED